MAEVEEDGGDRSSKLMPELLHLVCRCLPDTGDLVRFRAVCTVWRDAAPVSEPPSQLPWLLKHRRASSFDGLTMPQLCFYSHSSNRMYNLRIVGRRSWILGSGTGQGYVVATIDLSCTMLYNPITGEKRVLPPAPFKPWLDGVFTVLDDSEAGCVVVNTCVKTRQFAFCFSRPGAEAKWKVYVRPDLGNKVYHNGRFYANTSLDMATLVIDPATCAVETVVPRPRGEELYGVHGDYLARSHGKLLRAIKRSRSGAEAESSSETQAASRSKTQAVPATDFYFNVYQLDVHATRGKALWMKVDTIEDVVLFFDDYGHGFSLEPNDAAGLRKNCIHFMHERRTWLWKVWVDRFLCRYNMEDGRVDRTISMDDETLGDTWVVPTLCRLDE